MKRENKVLRLYSLIILILLIYFLYGCTSYSEKKAPVSYLTYDVNPFSNQVLFSNFKKEIKNSNTKLFIKGKFKKNTKIMTENGNNIVYNRNYDYISKGGYLGRKYVVKHGDTLFYVAWITGNDYHSLAKRNNINPPYFLKANQILLLDASINKDIAKKSFLVSKKINKYSKENLFKVKLLTFDKKRPLITYFGHFRNPEKSLLKVKIRNKFVSANTKKYMMNNISYKYSNNWYWPAYGKIIDNFSDIDGGNKGIDIEGFRGQSVFSSASGEVVYVGHAIQGYGNLIIIKHGDNYLSAYAHNDAILVRAEENVRAGQKIATIGSSGTNSVRLHFEIRHKGKSVNPFRYLPQR